MHRVTNVQGKVSMIGEQLFNTSLLFPSGPVLYLLFKVYKVLDYSLGVVSFSTIFVKLLELVILIDFYFHSRLLSFLLLGFYLQKKAYLNIAHN